MKWLVYNILQYEDEDGVVLSEKQMQWSEANLEIARAESYNGVEPEVIDDGQHNYPVAPHNIVAGEYVTVNSVLYLATENIPSGEPIIVGQNAVQTTVEDQLYALTKGE